MVLSQYIHTRDFGIAQWYSFRLACMRSGSIPGSDRPKLLEQAVTGPMPSPWQQVQLSRVLGDDYYKRRTIVKEGVAR